jgi:hypothetical protein
MKVFIKKAKSMDKESMFGQMVHVMLVNGLIIKFKVKVNIFG